MSEDVDKRMRFKAEISIGTLLVIVSMAASAAGVMYQIGATRADLANGIKAQEASIKSEHDLREAEFQGVTTAIKDVRDDLRELRTAIAAPSPAHR
jgi:hypothetical protein